MIISLAGRIARSGAYRLSALTGHTPAPVPALLEMVWPETRLSGPPSVSVPQGYTLRQYLQKDREAYISLLGAVEMLPCPLEYWERHVLPDGFFVIEHDETGALVATCMASHHTAPRHSRAGNFGWLATDPTHRGKQLGQAVAAAVTARLIAGGYRRIYLETHDFRLPAIKTYLKMGWVPLLYQEDMGARWKAVCAAIGWPFQPDQWPH